MLKRLIEGISNLVRKYHLHAFRDVAIFIVILLFFHFVWKVFVSNFFTVDFVRASADWLALQVYYQSKWVVGLFTEKITYFDHLFVGKSLRHNVFYYSVNNGFVYVNASCSGLKQFYQWFFLMVLFPGPWKHKIWFIPMGIVIIHFVNVLRIIVMVFTTMNLVEHWDFIHDWIMRPFFYVVMFTLWVWWNERFHLAGKKQG